MLVFLNWISSDGLYSKVNLIIICILLNDVNLVINVDIVDIFCTDSKPTNCQSNHDNMTEI